MSGQDSISVTLAHVDPSLLSCWEGMVKRGEECSLLLKHSKGKVVVTLQCATPSPSPTLTSPAKKKKKKKRKGNEKKRLEALLAYHQRLVVEKGLPPSRLMKQHAAAFESASAPPTQSAEVGKPFKCDQCDFSSDSKRGLKVHKGRAHKDQQLPENLRVDPGHDALASLPCEGGADGSTRSEPCPSCGVEISSSHNCERLQCECCEEAFFDELTLKTHMKSVHQSCDNCHIWFSNIYKWHEHYEEVHN